MEISGANQDHWSIYLLADMHSLCGDVLCSLVSLERNDEGTSDSFLFYRADNFLPDIDRRLHITKDNFETKV